MVTMTKTQISPPAYEGFQDPAAVVAMKKARDELYALAARLDESERNAARLLAENQRLHIAKGELKKRALKAERALVFCDESNTKGRFCGCYILYLNDKALYVGQSINVFSRIQSHRGVSSYPTYGLFDRIEIIWSEADQLDALEKQLIERLQPPGNSFGVTSPHIGQKLHTRKGFKPGAGLPAAMTQAMTADPGSNDI